MKLESLLQPQGMALMYPEKLDLFFRACRSDCPAYTYCWAAWAGEDKTVRKVQEKNKEKKI